MIHAESQPARYQVRFSNGAQTSMADATADHGGAHLGFRPHELLEAALATCMNMSLRMHAERHGLPLAGVDITLALDRSAPDRPAFEYSIDLLGPLSEAEKRELLAALESCPVRKTLSKPLDFVLRQA